MTASAVCMVVGISFATALAQTPSSRSCLSYEPAVVKLSGTLVRKTFPGPPNYENIHRGDRPETYWLLKLSQPVCVNEDKSEPSLNPAHDDIRSVQLVLTGEAYKKYKTLVGKRVVATGTLFGEHTGHHHTPVLLTVSGLTHVEGTTQQTGEYLAGQEPKCSIYLKPRYLTGRPQDKKVANRYKKVLPGGSRLMFVLPVLSHTEMLVYEPPNPENDPPDTHLLLLRGGVVAKRTSFRKMRIRKEYRVVSAARLCAGDTTMIFLAAGAGATGVSEFFVALLFNETGFRTFSLPEANQGRLEIFESYPFTVKLWSATNEDMGYCGACPKHYDVSNFKFEGGAGFQKTGHKRTQKKVSPDPLIDRPLLLHRAHEPRKQAPSL